MREIDIAANATIGVALSIVAVGAVVMAFGVACAGCFGWFLINVLGTTGGTTAGWVLALLASWAPVASAISLPGMIILLAIGWGRISARWQRRKWEAFQEDDE